MEVFDAVQVSKLAARWYAIGEKLIRHWRKVGTHSHMAPYGACEVEQSGIRSNAVISKENRHSQVISRARQHKAMISRRPIEAKVIARTKLMTFVHFRAAQKRTRVTLRPSK